MTGHIEPLAAVLRIGGEYGEPYTWAATLRYLSPTEVEICGVTVSPTPGERRAIREVLRANGIHRAKVVRYDGDEPREIWLTK